MNYFTLDSFDSRSIDTYIATSNAFDNSAEEVQAIQVPGSNNIYYQSYGNYKPFDLKVYCYTKSLVNVDSIRQFLLSQKKVMRYTESIRPNEYRLVRFIDAYEVDKSDRVGARFMLVFKAEHPRYLTENETISLEPTSTTTTDTTLSLTTISTPLDITLQGNTTQNGTPTPTSPIEVQSVKGDNEVKVVGKNLQELSLRDNLSNITFSGVTLDYNATKFRIHGTATASGGRTTLTLLKTFLTRGTYTISAQNITGTIGTLYGYLHNSSHTIIGTAFGFVGTTTSTTVTVTESGEYYIGFNITSGNTYDVYFNIQLEHGTTQTTYEPYTEQSYEVDLPVENLWSNKKAVTDSNNSEVYIDGEWLHFKTGGDRLFYYPNTQGQLTFQGIFKSEQNRANAISLFAYYTDGTNEQLFRINANDTEEHFITATTNASKTVSYFRSAYTDSVGAFVKNVQLEKGSVANTYTPYGTTPIELNKIGDYQDYLYKSGDKWYVHKEFNKVDLGTLTWTAYNDTMYANLTDAYRPTYTVIASILCTALTPQTLTVVNDKSQDNVIALNNGQSRVNAYASAYTTRADFKTVMSGSMLYYPMLTPTNTEITYTPLINQLNEIEKATSYDGVTNILQDNSGNPFVLEVVSLRGETLTSEYNGEPIITVNEEGLISWNGNIIKVNKAPMVINSQTMQSYLNNTNMNNDMDGDYPMIEIGGNKIGSTMALSIVPNYWKH